MSVLLDAARIRNHSPYSATFTFSPSTFRLIVTIFDMADSHCVTFLDLDGHVWEVIHHPNAFWEGAQVKTI